MSPDPPLHPRRIQAAIEWLSDEDYAAKVETDTVATCLAALRLLQKTQSATGLTPNIADVGVHGLKLLKSLMRIR